MPMPPNKTPAASTSLTTNNNTTPDASRQTGLTNQRSGLKLPALHARLRQNITSQTDPNTCRDRIALMLDVSGSMAGPKIVALRDAACGFVQACDMTTTSVAIEPFGEGSPPPHRLPLTCVQPMLVTTSMSLVDGGSTPMAQAMDYVINAYGVTRAVIVSDGEPDNAQACYDTAAQYRDAKLMIDCVHIGDSTSGEACLRRIAEITGGQYIKFTDVAQFSKSFKYLTPAFYGILTSGGLSASDIGAKELK